MSYKIKVIKKDILNEISQYLYLIFKHDYFDKDYLHWKYFDNLAGKSIILGAYDKEKIVGFKVLELAIFQISNKVNVLYYFCLALKHKEYHGKHICLNYIKKDNVFIRSNRDTNEIFKEI